MLLDYIDEFRKSADHSDNQDFQIKCFGFAPACGLSLELSERYKDHIQSYVFGDDVVSKMSYGSMMDVKELVIASSEAAHGMSLSKVFLSGQPDSSSWKRIFESVADCRAKCLESLANPRVSKICWARLMPPFTDIVFAPAVCGRHGVSILAGPYTK